MKKILFFVALFITAAFATSHADIITVDNKTPSAGDFSALQTAHDGANPGDTIYVYPSAVAYDAITVTKRLAFVGTGFDYPSEAMKTTLIKGTMTFSAGSDGSRLEAFGGGFPIIVDANDVMIKRNRLHTITVSENHTGTVILQNFIKLNVGYAVPVINVASSNELLVANNILIHVLSTGIRGVIANSPSITITMLHNIICLPYGAIPLWVGNSDHFVANNIIFGCLTRDFDYAGFYYNIHRGHESTSYCPNLPTSNGNITVYDMNTVFVDWANHDFHLLPDSPAIGTGQNGVDMGIYGGSTPFVDGGAPGLPSISELQSDHVGAQSRGLDVVIKAKTNPE